PAGADYHLALWHGLNLPLLLTVAILAIGAAMFAARDRIDTPVYLPLGNADRIYDAVLRGIEFISFKLTAATQRGSLPATQTVILTTLVVLPSTVLAL
ncbi:Na+/H+ antiporter subunit A, partial [Mycolicibacterium insubricum]|nr:Na+/H+ antiporter subunit A [Mycolicibacterium insubricum]